MAGTRIHGEFQSYAGAVYDIFVYDANFVASANTFPGVWGDPSTGDAWGDPSTGDVWGWDALDDLENPPGIQTHKVGLPGFVLSYETENEKAFTPLMPSRLTFRLFIENATQETLLNSLANSSEGDYLVRVLKNGALYWSGVLLYDIVQWEDVGYPYEIQLTAVDGLSRLREIEYPDASLIGANKQTFLEIVFSCMAQLETNGFYAANDQYLINNVDWWESRHVASQAVDPLALTRINSNILYDADPTGDDFQFFSCYDVLKQICQMFGARMFHANGTWWIQQVDQYTFGGQKRRIYLKDATLFSSVTVSWDVLCDQRTIARADGRYEYLPPLKKAEVIYRHRSSGASLLTGAQWTWENDGQLYEVGEVSDNGGVAKLRFSMDLEHTWRYAPQSSPPTPDELIYAIHQFRFELKVGLYYFVGDAVNAQWTTTAGYYEVLIPLAIQWQNYTRTIEFTTPALPAGSQGECSISFEYVTSELETYGPTVLPLGGATPGFQYWGQYTPLLVLLADGNETQTVDNNKYVATNPNTGNSQTITLTQFFGDGPTPGTLSRLETFDGSAWADSGELWGEGVSGTRTEKILELLAATIVSTQIKPVVKYVGKLITTDNRTAFWPYSRLKINRKYYIFLGGTFEANEDAWTSVHLFHIASDTSIVAPDIPVEDSPIGTLLETE